MAAKKWMRFGVYLHSDPDDPEGWVFAKSFTTLQAAETFIREKTGPVYGYFQRGPGVKEVGVPARARVEEGYFSDGKEKS